MSATTRGALAVAALLAAAAPARAQKLQGHALGYMVQRRSSFQGTVDQQTGTWFGLAGSVRLSRLTIGVSGLFGSLSGAADPQTTPDLDVRVSNIWLGVQATPWLGLAAVAEANHQESDAGATAWRLIGPQVRLTPPLGLPGLSASAEFTYFASATVIGGSETMSPAIRGTVGAEYAPLHSPVSLRVSYRFERYDFTDNGSGVPRLEQFSGVLAGVGVRLGR